MQGSNGFDDDALASVHAIVDAAVDQGQVPGVVAAVARGNSVHVAVAGVMAIGGAPMRRDTLFRITSMTKPMTAAAVLSFVDDGLLKLPSQDLAVVVLTQRAADETGMPAVCANVLAAARAS